MAAYIAVDLTPINAEKMQKYGAAATIADHGGEFVVKGPISLLTPSDGQADRYQGHHSIP